MCGIGGVVGPLGSANTGAVLAALAHRGPDDEGEYRNGPEAATPIWFGHRRLSVIDPSPAGRQPMQTRDGRHTLVFNGEIYNYRELRDALSDFEPRTGTDTEVLLEVLAREGAGAIPRLRGMFAFALWDERQSTLTLARDRHGEKPLYYFVDPACRRFLFASEVRALLASGVVPRRLDPDGLDGYLAVGSAVDPYTLVRGVRAVPAGGSVLYASNRLVERRYWSLCQQPVDESMPRHGAVEQTRSLLEAAQRRCLVADVPVGILLSGGIDSSINVALLAAMGTPSLHTFSVVFGDADSGLSEKQYSDLVARRFGTHHESCSVTLDDAGEFLERAVASMDQPSHDGLNSYAVSEAVRAAGLKVAVSGQAADELFLGYPQRHRFASLRRKATLLPGLVGRLASSWGRRGDWHGGDGRYAKLATAGGARDSAAGAYLALHGMFSHRALQRLRGERRPHPERFLEPVGGKTALDILSRLQLRHYLRDTLLRDADQCSMAHGLELRAPYLDHDLVDFLLTVPARHKLESARNKPLLLDAAGGELPRQVWDRPKRGFSMPVGRWMLAGLAPARAPEIPGLDPTAVAAVRRQFAQQGPKAPFNYMQAWTLDVLGMWLQRHGITTI